MPGHASVTWHDVQHLGESLKLSATSWVTVSCVANLAAFHVIGFPVSQTFGDTAAAPLDPFEDRG